MLYRVLGILTNGDRVQGQVDANDAFDALNKAKDGLKEHGDMTTVRVTVLDGKSAFTVRKPQKRGGAATEGASAGVRGTPRKRR